MLAEADFVETLLPVFDQFSLCSFYSCPFKDAKYVSSSNLEASTCLFSCEHEDDLLKHLEHSHALFIPNAKQIRFIISEYCLYLFELSRSTNTPLPCLLERSDEEEWTTRKLLFDVKLSRILKIQEQERLYVYKKRFTCLFCPLEFPNLPEGYEHMTSQHRLSIGKLYNLVYIEELLGKLNQHVNVDLTCLYCEKKFPDAATLKKHCRNSKHYLNMNPNNQNFDKFYIVNYVFKCEKKHVPNVSPNGWTAIDRRASRAEATSDSEVEENPWNDWSEDECDLSNRASTLSTQVQCPFDSHFCPSVDELVSRHFPDCHSSFSPHSFFKLHQLNDIYDRIKFINYLRMESSHCRCFYCHSEFSDSLQLNAHLNETRHIFELPDKCHWANPQYLLPINENDPLLTALESFDDF